MASKRLSVSVSYLESTLATSGASVDSKQLGVTTKFGKVGRDDSLEPKVSHLEGVSGLPKRKTAAEAAAFWSFFVRTGWGGLAQVFL